MSTLRRSRVLSWLCLALSAHDRPCTDDKARSCEGSPHHVPRLVHTTTSSSPVYSFVFYSLMDHFLSHCSGQSVYSSSYIVTYLAYGNSILHLMLPAIRCREAWHLTLVLNFASLKQLALGQQPCSAFEGVPDGPGETLGSTWYPLLTLQLCPR